MSPGVRRENAFGQLARATLINCAPITVTLGLSLTFFRAAYPGSVKLILVATLGLYFAAELLAWWIPYAVGASPERTARYAEMFGKTHAFLGERHGMTPNTLHVTLHAATAVALVQALWLSLM
jgi:hypothetical protein